MMGIKSEITQAKKRLIAKAKKKGGIYENFGMDEDRKLRDKYYGYQYGTPKQRAIYDEIDKFFVWASTMDDNKLKKVV
jgi:hypothetical protein